MSQGVNDLRNTGSKSLGNLDRISSPIAPREQGSSVAGPGFEEALRSRIDGKPGPGIGQMAPSGLRFSNHAVDRMRSRGVRFSPEEMTKIEGALKKAQAKGAKDTLVLMHEKALILNAKTATVVTVMDREGLKENVFTNIDSTIVL